MKNPWKILGIKKTNDSKAIRRAYATRLKLIDQIKERQTFEDLRAAYDACLAQAAYLDYSREPEEPHSGPDEFLPQVVAARQNDISESGDTEPVLPDPMVVPDFLFEDAKLLNSQITGRQHKEFSITLREILAKPEYATLHLRDQLQDLILEYIYREETQISGYFFEKLVEAFHWQYPFRPRTPKESMLFSVFQKVQGSEIGRVETVAPKVRFIDRFDKSWLWLAFGLIMLMRALFSNTCKMTPAHVKSDFSDDCASYSPERILAPTKEHKTEIRYQQIFQTAKDVKLCMHLQSQITYTRFEIASGRRLAPVSLVKCAMFAPAFVTVPSEHQQKQTRPPADLLCVGGHGEITDIAAYYGYETRQKVPGKP